MSAVTTPVDQATDLMQKLSVETKNNAGDAPVVAKKPSGIQYVPLNAGQAPMIQMPSLERSSTPVMPGYVDPNVYYMSNGYPSTAFYFGGYDGLASEWDEYSGYLKAEGSEMPQGVYGDIYQHGYGYAPYGSQYYQYPSPYFQPQASLNAPYSSNHFLGSHGEVAPPVFGYQPSITVGSDGSNANLIANGIANSNSGYIPQNYSQQSSFFSNGSYGRGVLSSGQPFSCYQDPGLSFDGMSSSIPWYNGHAYTNSNLNSATPQYFSSISTRNPNGLNCLRTTPVLGQVGSGMMNMIYPTNLMYGQHDLGSQLYDPRMNFYGFYGYGNENFDGLSELNRGPRANRFKILKGPVPTDEKIEDPNIVPNRDQYNRADFCEIYTEAKFFIIKSYSEDDIHRSIKYSVWSSTPSGNKKLDAAYKEAMDKADGCPVFLFFSVNTSGQFVGVAEMVGPVDFNKTVDFWQQDKWIGCFNVKWHIVKDVPNSILRHITLEYNENKPVTNSRDNQEVKIEQGLQVLKIFKDHVSKTSILDDFGFYESREKVLLEKRARQQRPNKQAVAVKLTEPVGGKDKETADSRNSVAPGGPAESSDDSCPPRVTVDIQNGTKPANETTEIANGVSQATLIFCK